jgi:TolB-like protein
VRAAQERFAAEGLAHGWLREAWRPRAVAAAPLERSEPEREDAHGGARRASVAIMPFGGDIGDAFTHDVITRLAKLRSLFVIAEGTVFALHRRGIGAEEAGRTLDVDYIASGAVRNAGGRLTIAVELAQTRTSRIVWADDFNRVVDGAFELMDEITDSIVATIASEIEANERNRAILAPPSSLDAWQAYHRGLWHMYRFNHEDNEQARRLFDTAVRLDPTFGRAHTGLSFTHFQSAFQSWGDRELEMERAYDHAGRSLLLDDRDPAAHWAMGRALWLRGRHGASVSELEQAVDLSPNFALGHYALAFVNSQTGDPVAAISAADRSRRLSPFDPLLFAMLASRAVALARLGRYEEAAGWGAQAATRPNAHVHIFAIAALCLALAGQLDEARALVATIRQRQPGYGIADFLRAFHMDPDGAALFRSAARRVELT